MNKPLNRVPEITIYFWIIKVLATTVGETAADFLSTTLGFGLATTSYIMSGVLLIVLLNQFRLKRYVPVSYWLAVVLASIVGTLITDRLVDKLGVSLVTTNIIFGVSLAIVFAIWYANEKTLAMHSIHTAKRELFYWIAILLAFALGTATGDYLAEALNLGYFQALLLFGAAISLTALSYHYLRLNAVLAFWIAYILTRPLGASLGDLLTQPRSNGGFGYGATNTSILFFCVISSLVIYLSLKQKRAKASVSDI